MDTTRAASRKDSLASLRRKALPLSLSLLLCGALASAPAMAGTVGATTTPTGGSIVGGSGNIVQDGASVVINQASSKLVLNWQSFNLGQDASVRFNQPGASAVALNRILDQNPSQIFGQISSNGQVFLINTHGIIFGTTAQVNVGGLVASTLDLTPTDFLSNHFNLNAVGGGAGIVNHGTIAAASGGSVSLIGGSVQNEGVILANYGRINLDGADHAVLDFDGNGLINVQITGQLEQRLDAKAAVSNAGTLQADGGTVVLEASAARDLFTGLVNNSGVIDAGGISHDGGEVRLVARGGDVASNGSIDVSGAHGGTVQVLSDRSVAVDGSINASGAQGGGSIRIGGGERGGEGLLHADSSSMGAGAVLTADATRSGNGGSIVVWGDRSADVAGRFSARGGALDGAGGVVETSAETVDIADSTRVDTRAAHGLAGQWLIDPREYTIAASGGNITGAALSTNLGTGNVTILSSSGSTPSGSGSIFVNDAVSWSANTLTLTASNNVEINAAMSASGSAGLALNPATTNGGSTAVAGGHININSSGTLTLAGSGSMALAGAVNDAGTLDISGLASGLSIDSLAGTGTVALGGRTLTLNNAADTFGGIISGTGGVTLVGGNETFSGTNTYSGGTTLDGGTLTVSSDANLGNASGGLVFNGGTLATSAAFSSARNVTLQGGNGTVQTGADLVLTGVVGGSGRLTKTGSGKLTLGNTNTYGGGTQVKAGTLAIASNANLGATGGTLTLDGGTLENTAVLTLNRTLALGAAGGTLQTDAGLTLVGAVSGAGALTQTGAGPLTLGGDVSTGGNQTYNGPLLLGSDATLTSTGGSVNLAGTVDNADGTRRALSVAAANGGVTFGGTVGAGTNGALASLTTSSQSFNANALNVDGNLSVTTTAGAIAQGGAFRVGGSATFDAGSQAITLTHASNAFTGAVSLTGGAAQIASNGPLSLGTTHVASLVAGAGGNVITLGGNVTSSGGQTYSDAVALGTDATLTSTGGGTIDFASTVDGAHSLGVSTSGGVLFGGAVGAGTNLAGLTTSTGTFSAAGTVGVSGNLSVTTTAGDIGQGGPFSVGGTAHFDAGGNAISLTAANAFSGAVSLSNTGAHDVALVGSGLLTLGDVHVGSGALSLTGGAGLAQASGTTIVQGGAGVVTLDAGTGALSLANGGNDFVGSVTASGTGVSLGDGNDLTLAGLTNNGGAVDLAAGGNLTLPAAAITSAGAISLAANGGTLATAGDLSGASVSLSGYDGLTLAHNITASGSLALTSANGAIGQAAGILTAASLSGSSKGGTTLGNLNAITSLGNFSAGGFSLANGQTLTVAGTVDGGSNTALGTTIGDLVINGTVGNLGGSTSLTSAGAISEGASGVVQAGTLTGSSVGATTLGGNNLVATLGNFSADGFQLVDAQALTVGAGATVSGGTGGTSIKTTTGNLAIDGALGAAGATTSLVSAGSVTEGASGVVSAGTLTGSAAGDVTLGGGNLIATLGSFGSGNFTLVNAQALTLAGPLNASGNVDVSISAGGLSVTTGIDAGGNDIRLAASAGSLGVSADLSGRDVTLEGRDGVTVGAGVAVQAGRDLGLTSTGAAIDGNGSFQVGRTATVNAGAGAITLVNAANHFGGSVNLAGGSTRIADSGALSLGTLATGDLEATSHGALDLGSGSIGGALVAASNGGTIGQTGALSVTGTSQLTAGAGAVTLTQNNQLTGAVTVQAGGGVALETSTDLTVASLSSGGAVSLVAGGALNLPGGGIDTGSNDLTLAANGGSLSTSGVLKGGNVSLTGRDGVLLGHDVTASGALTLASTNAAIGQTAGTLTVGGASTVNAGGGDITLTSGTNAFTGAVSLTGATTRITGSNALALGTLSTGALTATSTGDLDLGKGAVAGALQATSGGAISQDAGGLTVGGNSVLQAGGSITLADGNNDFVGSVDLTGGATSIQDRNALSLGTLATGALTATSAGTLGLGSGNVGGDLTAISTSGGIGQAGALVVTGTSRVDAGSGGIMLTDMGNQFGGAVSLAGGITQIGSGSDLALGTLATRDLTVTGNAALNLGSGNVGGTLTATSQGPISQSGALVVTGPAALDAGGGSITLTQANDFQAGLDLAGNGIAVHDANDLSVGTLAGAPNGAVSLTADGVLTLPATAIDTGSGSLLLASNGGTLATRAALSGASVSLSGRDGITLAHDVTTAGTLALASTAGNVAQTAGTLTAGTLTGSAGGSVSLGGANAVGQLGSFSANGFSLATAGTLAVTGPVDAGSGSVDLHSTGALNVAGDIRGNAITLRGDGGIGQSSGSIDAGSGLVSLQSGAAIAQTGGAIGAGTLAGNAAGGVTLAGNNRLGTLGGFSAASLSLHNAQSLAVAGPVTTTGNTAITVQGNLALDGTLDAANTTLNVDGAISQGASGSLATGMLAGQAGGDVTLNGNNHVVTLGNFNAANFRLTNAQALAVNGSLGVGTGTIALTTTAGALTVNSALSGGGIALDSAADLVLGKSVQAGTVSLASAGSISQTATGLITAGTLSGQSAGSTTLDHANAIGALGNFTAQGLSVASTQALDVTGVVDGGASTALLSGGDLRIDGTLRGDATSLSAGGGISEGASGVLVAHVLSGQAGGAVALDGANRVDTLGHFQAAGFSLHDAQDLHVAGTLDGGASTALSTTGNLVLDGVVKGGATRVDVGGALSQSSAGAIVADTLGGHVAGAASLTGTNAIARLGDFDAAGLALRNGQALTVDGTVDGGASVALTTTAGGLTVAGSLAGASTTLDVAGSIDQTTRGRITAGTLTGQAGGDVVLDGDNRVATLGGFSARDFTLSNGQALAVNGPLAASGGAISLATTAGTLSVGTDLSGSSIALASAGDLALGHAIHGGAVSLQSGGAISQAAGGLITADSLSGHSAGSTILDQANAIAALGDFHASGLKIATGGALAVNGVVDGGGSTALATGGNLSIAGTLNGDSTTLAVGGAISETGSITAHTLSGHAGGTASLTGANRIDALGAFAASGFALINGPSLAVNGPLDGGNNVALTTTRGDLAINGKVTGKTTTLTSSGAITEGQGGSITAATLSGRAGGRTQLGTATSPLANYIGTLGGFSSPAGFSLTNAQTITLASVGGSSYTVDAGTSSFYLGVTGGDLLQAGTTPLFDGQGTFASTGRIGTSAAPIYVTGTGPQAVAMVGLPPAYFYAVNRSGALLPLTGGSSVNVPTSLFTSRAQNANNHTDVYIDPSVISANYRSFGIVPSGILLPPDQQACDPQQEECDE